MVSRTEWAQRPRRESVAKRLGRVARQIAGRDRFACVYCHRTAIDMGAPLHLDHLVPRSQGGPDIPTNLVLACGPHNSARHDLPVRKFAKIIGMPARDIWAQARRKLPVWPLAKAVNDTRAASPAGIGATCTVPLESGKICGKPAVIEEMIAGILCPLCSEHEREMREEESEESPTRGSYSVRSRGRVVARFATKREAEAFVRSFRIRKHSR
jgi:hypothetical protein